MSNLYYKWNTYLSNIHLYNDHICHTWSTQHLICTTDLLSINLVLFVLIFVGWTILSPLLITIDFYNQDCFLYILGIFLRFECSKLFPLFEVFDQVIFISFYFVVRATQVTQQALSSDNVGKSLDSSLMHSIFLKSLVNNLKIFSTTQLVGNVSPFLPSRFTIV